MNRKCLVEFLDLLEREFRSGSLRYSELKNIKISLVATYPDLFIKEDFIKYGMPGFLK